MTLRHILLTLLLLTLAACTPAVAAVSIRQSPTPQSVVARLELTPTTTVTFFQPVPYTATPTPSPTATSTSTPTPIPTDTPTATPMPTSTPTWVTIQAGDVTAPILLYHHVGNSTADSRYYVSPDKFREQMAALHEWGYTPITISTLVEVLIQGGQLPERPVVITFDDGNQDVYDNAFPIMQEFGYPGVFFIVASRLDIKDFVNTDHLKEMVDAGWEIGSHTMYHANLINDHSIVRQEVLQSRLTLEDALGVPVKIFAYPFGLTDPFVSEKVQDYGYRAAVGLGVLDRHTWNTLYYLNRREVQGTYSLDDFAALLPWKGAP